MKILVDKKYEKKSNLDKIIVKNILLTNEFSPVIFYSQVTQQGIKQEMNCLTQREFINLYKESV